MGEWVGSGRDCRGAWWACGLSFGVTVERTEAGLPFTAVAYGGVRGQWAA